MLANLKPLIGVLFIIGIALGIAVSWAAGVPFLALAVIIGIAIAVQAPRRT